jgi:flagellar FliL protein
MGLFGKKQKAPKVAEPAEEDAADEAVPEVGDESSVELKAEALAPKVRGGHGGILALIIGMVAITVVAAAGGVGLGMQVSATIERAIADRDARAPLTSDGLVPKYTSDMSIRTIEPVIANLASPSDTWVRLESAMVFKTGGLPNPEVTAAEIRQDQLAYLRTIDIGQLQGPSALQHLREDLNERASLRTGGKVTEVVIETLIVQ